MHSKSDDMKIEAVFFDMGGTIDMYEYSPELRLAKSPGLQRLLAASGISLGLSTEQLYQVVSEGLRAYRKVTLETLDELPPEVVWAEYILLGYPVDKDRLYSCAEELMCYIETEFFNRPMRPEIPSVLKAVREMGFKIGLISNVNSRGQVPKNLTEYKIKQFFNPMVLSSELGRRKPDPSLFYHAARLVKTPTSACLHIGDRISRDILGARRAGFGMAVQIRHAFHAGEFDEGPTPDHVIDSMDELVEILRAEKKSYSKKDPVKPKTDVRAVLFDAGDVLYFRSHRNQQFNTFLEEQGTRVLDPEIEEKRASLREQAYCGKITQQEYLEAYLQILGVRDPAQIERGRQILMAEKNAVEFFEGVQQTLFTLKERGFLLGVVTDTAHPYHIKISWLEQGGIGHVWDSIISSTDIGVRKPDPKIYGAVLEQLGVRADQAVFVGHKVSELDGARAVGIKTIAFNYDEGAKADHYIKKFDDILSLPFISFESKAKSGG